MHSTPSIDVTSGLMPGVRQVLSPHFDQRPPGVLPELIVVHGISLPPGEFGGPWIDRLFAGNLPAGCPPEFCRHRGSAGIGACGHPPRWRDHAVCAVRGTRLACR